MQYAVKYSKPSNGVNLPFYVMETMHQVQAFSSRQEAEANRDSLQQIADNHRTGLVYSVVDYDPRQGRIA